MAATVEEVGRPGGEPRSWIVNEGDRLIAVCYSRERAERVCAALNEVAALRAQVARVRALYQRLCDLEERAIADEAASVTEGGRAMSDGMAHAFGRAARDLRAALDGDGGA